MAGEMRTEPTGILSCAAYVPRWRLSKSTISAASGWANGMSREQTGLRSFANWDEDSITMAVEAARLTVNELTEPGLDLSIKNVSLVSTSLPFADRSNCGLMAEALNLGADIAVKDLTGSRNAAVGELIQLQHSARTVPQLLCASDCVDTLPASEAELSTGHGAAALVFGQGPVLATILGSCSIQQDFLDQYRMSEQRFGYTLEARWLRDEGIRPQFSGLCKTLLEQAQIKPDQIKWLLAPVDASLNRILLNDCRLEHAQTADVLMKTIGYCGVAHPIIMLAWALEQAEEGDLILLAGLGQGCDLVLLQVHARAGQKSSSLQLQLKAERPEENYTRYLGIRQLLAMDRGIRSERDNRTSQSAYYRRHLDVNGFNGGLCSACGKLQFPRYPVCVHCQARDTQRLHPMAELTGEVNSYTEDWLAYSPRPPLMFGNVHFPGGANVLMEFSDFLPGELQAGMPVRMAFRIKDMDPRRNFRRYFWKPTPMLENGRHG
jgi:hydroxymethylglutaryl-CoA synthase